MCEYPSVFVPARFGFVFSLAVCFTAVYAFKRDEIDAFLKVGDCFSTFTKLESQLKLTQDSRNVQQEQNVSGIAAALSWPCWPSETRTEVLSAGVLLCVRWKKIHKLLEIG